MSGSPGEDGGGDDAAGDDGGAPDDAAGRPDRRGRTPRGEDEEAVGPFGLDKRTLIRLLVGLGIGLPVLLEASTLLGLLGNVFGGDDGDGDTPTATATERGVGVGDELLPETAAADTVRASYVAADGWTYTLVVGVDNTTDRTYDLRLGAVTTEGGDVVEGGGESGPIEPGESGAVTGRWEMPDGSSPASLEVTAIARDGTVTTVERTVELGSVPVQGG